MRTITETIIKPAETHEKRTYECERCEYQTRDADDAKVHEGLTHSASGHAVINGVDLFKFDSKESFNAYLEAYAQYDRNTYYRGEWNGPGWYGQDYINPPGSYDDGAYFIPIARFEEGWKRKIELLNTALSDAANLK